MLAKRVFLAYLLLVPLGGSLFLAGGHFAANWLIGAQQARHLEELVQVALRRSELAIDYGVVAINEVAARGPVECGALALQAIRLQIYRSGSLKDIRAVSRNGVVRCSAYSETLEFDKSWPSRDSMLVAIDGTVRLFAVDQFFGTALGLMKEIDGGNGIAGILDVDGSLFDIMPDELRDNGNIILELGNGKIIAESHTGWISVGSDDPVNLSAQSDRYPMRVNVNVERSVLGSWYNEPYITILLSTGLIGFVFGYLLARLVARPVDPVAEIDKAIANREFHPYFQPIFELESRRIIGAEVLSRWVKSDGSIVQPARFIELAEETGRIEKITWHQFDQALIEMRSILTVQPEFKLSFNITPSQFIGPGFISRLKKAVERADAAPHQITIELTEREAFSDAEEAARIVGKVQALGFEVSIDDVGIGHSGLSQIQRLGANGLKVDKFFVDALEQDRSVHIVIEMLVRLAHKRGMTLVAEGIESEEQVALLRECGVRHGQGYILSQPVPGLNFIASYGKQWLAGAKATDVRMRNSA